MYLYIKFLYDSTLTYVYTGSSLAGTCYIGFKIPIKERQYVLNERLIPIYLNSSGNGDRCTII